MIIGTIHIFRFVQKALYGRLTNQCILIRQLIGMVQRTPVSGRIGENTSINSCCRITLF